MTTSTIQNGSTVKNTDGNVKENHEISVPNGGRPHSSSNDGDSSSSLPQEMSLVVDAATGTAVGDSSSSLQRGDSSIHSTTMTPLCIDTEGGGEIPPAAAAEHFHPPASLLTTLPLAVIVFYNVSGGPFGMEASVRAGGAFYTLLGLIIGPLIWSLPEALVTAELGSTFPEPSGGVAWVQEAFGGTAGWIMGWLSWISGATDTCIYPVLFLDYVLQIIGGGVDSIHWSLRFSLVAVLSTVLTFINYLGLKIVGETSILICILSMSPFVLAIILGIPKVEPSRWLTMPDPEEITYEPETTGILPTIILGGVLWRPFLNNLFWNLNSFDSGASFSAEVEDPGRTFPRAMFWSVLMVFLAYFLPMLVLLGASDQPQSAWVDGYLATIISEEIGKWLGDWTVFAAGISNIALFQAEMSTDAFQLMGMAARGYLPKIFATRSRYGTPTYGLLAGLLVVLLLGVSDLSMLVEMLNFNYSIALMMEYAAFLKLRVVRPEVHRPWRIPLSTFGCCVFLLPPVIMTVFILLLASVKTWGMSFLTATIGMLLYRAAQMRKCRECCYYAPLPVEDDEEQDMSMNGDGIMRSNSDGEGGGIALRHMSS